MDPLYTFDPWRSSQVPPTRPDSAPGKIDYDHPLRGICTRWIEKIKLAQAHKAAQFGDDAKECMRFFNGPYDFMYQRDYSKTSPGFRMQDDEFDLPAPTFQMTWNKIAEGVQIFGPTLYHKHPYRQVNPRELPQMPFGIATAIANQTYMQSLGNPQQQGAAPAVDPMQMQQFESQLSMSDQLERAKDIARSKLMEWYLNYTPNELNLKENIRKAIDEMLIKGMGLLWTEVYTPPGSQQKLIGSFYDTVDNLQLDPDAEDRDHCQWIARRCIHPYWQVEREYGLTPESLRPYASSESSNAQGNANADDDGDYNRKQGKTNDLITYWKLYSRMGVGGRLNGTNPKYQEVLDQFGDYCFLVLVENCPHPINCPPDLINSPNGIEEIKKRLQWPVPYWMDDSWPFAPFEIHTVPRQLWPMSHFKPAMGLLKFLNWMYSFMASKIRVTSRDFLAVLKSAGTEIIQQIRSGGDLTLLELEATHDDIAKLIQFVQHPQWNGDIWTVLDRCVDNFEKSTGLSELMYGQTSTQMRSAQEANVKAGQLNIRPDDMANRVEDSAAQAAKLEAIAIRWHIGPQDVATIAGPTFAFYWGQLVTSQDPFAMCHQLEYSIEAGSSRKPNKDRDQANMTQFMQNFGPLFTQWAGMGNPQPYNTMMEDWGKANDKDVSKYMLAPMMPPPQPSPQGAKKPPTQQAA